MEPKNPSSQSRPEQVGGYVPSFPEVPGHVGVEQQTGQSMEQGQERPATQEQPQPSLPPPIIPLPQVNDISVVQNTTSTTNDIPLVANDDDVIEKEWVDKAKKIIAETKDDPYLREQKVSELQADYLRKRYGHELGEAA